VSTDHGCGLPVARHGSSSRDPVSDVKYTSPTGGPFTIVGGTFAAHSVITITLYRTRGTCSLHLLLPAIMCNYDAIHKTGNTQCVATPPKEDSVTVMGNTQTIGEVSSSGGMLADRQTHTAQTLLSYPYWGGVIM